MKICNLRIEKGIKSKLCADVHYNNKITTLWYEVDNKYEKFLCDELADSFLVVLLLFAMKNKEDIIIEGAPVTDELYYNLKNYLIPMISQKIKCYNSINIDCDLANIRFEDDGRLNGTGISRGVDSFYTIEEFTNNCSSDSKIDILTFFNIGAHGEYDSTKAFELFEKRKQTSMDFAINNSFKFIDVNSNISDFLMMNFESSHTFRNLSIVFALQKLFKKYYYSSGVGISDFKICYEDTANYDVLIMYYLSTYNVKFISSGASKSRLEKVQGITNYKPSYDNLSVCFKDDFNCGVCEKCIRTIFELYALEKLDLYNNSFDLEDFYNNKNKYETKFFENYIRKNGKLDYKKTYKLMKKNKIKVKKINIIKGLGMGILKSVYRFFRKLGK